MKNQRPVRRLPAHARTISTMSDYDAQIEAVKQQLSDTIAHYTAEAETSIAFIQAKKRELSGGHHA